MKQRIIKLKSITKNKWINLFEVQYINSKDKICNWIFASRKKNPYEDKSIDAVVIVATVDSPEGKKVVVTKEFRAPINDYEYGFPAGLIDKGESLTKTVQRELKEETGLEVTKFIGKSNTIISAAGLSDESTVVFFVEATGKIDTKYQEKVEDIEVFLYDIEDIKKLLSSDNKVGAKAWGVLYSFSVIGKIG